MRAPRYARVRTTSMSFATPPPSPTRAKPPSTDSRTRASDKKRQPHLPGVELKDPFDDTRTRYELQELCRLLGQFNFSDDAPIDRTLDLDTELAMRLHIGANDDETEQRTLEELSVLTRPMRTDRIAALAHALRLEIELQAGYKRDRSDGPTRADTPKRGRGGKHPRAPSRGRRGRDAQPGTTQGDK